MKCLNKTNEITFQCKNHENFKPMLISLSNNTGSFEDDDDDDEEEEIIFCSNCFNEKEHNMGNYVAIDHFIGSNEKTIIPKWPPLQNQSLLFEIYSKFQGKNKYLNNQNEIITQYFDSLKQQINQHIDDVKKVMLTKCNELPQLQEQLFKSYNQMAEKEKIKEIFTATNATYEQASELMNEILKQKEKSMEENQANLEKSYYPFLKHINSFDSKSPVEVKETLINMIKSIDFFPNITDEQDPKDKNNNNKTVSEIKKMENEENQCSLQLDQEVQSKQQQSSFISEGSNNTQIQNREQKQQQSKSSQQRQRQSNQGQYNQRQNDRDYYQNKITERKPKPDRKRYNQNSNRQKEQNLFEPISQKMNENQQTSQVSQYVPKLPAIPTLEDLKDKSEDQVKERLVTSILPRIDQILSEADKDKSNKIAGMIVDFEIYTIEDIIEMLQNPEELKETVAEALYLIYEHM